MFFSYFTLRLLRNFCSINISFTFPLISYKNKDNFFKPHWLQVKIKTSKSQNKWLSAAHIHVFHCTHRDCSTDIHKTAHALLHMKSFCRRERHKEFGFQRSSMHVAPTAPNISGHGATCGGTSQKI